MRRKGKLAIVWDASMAMGGFGKGATPSSIPSVRHSWTSCRKFR
jgi:hypothetical protein